MERNQDLIDHLTNLRSDISRLTTRFGDAGGSKKLQEITKQLQERDKMMDYLNNMDGSNGQGSTASGLEVSAVMEQQADPVLSKEI